MRTTLTIDDHLAAQLEAYRQRTGQSLRETVDELLREGLHAAQSRSLEPFVIEPLTAGAPTIPLVGKWSDLLDTVDPEAPFVVHDGREGYDAG